MNLYSLLFAYRSNVSSSVGGSGFPCSWGFKYQLGFNDQFKSTLVYSYDALRFFFAKPEEMQYCTVITTSQSSNILLEC